MKYKIITWICLLLISVKLSAEPDLFDLSITELTEIEITSASLISESIAESPVPVSVITAKMIALSGARHLKDLLTTYVPNFTAIEDQNEVNIASRGVYTSSQQKILIMLEGHRLNSRSFSMASPDYGISLDKIEQIEILRGPASSLYGNVALTATVNIKLKKGEDLDGTNLSLTLGNNNQKQLNALFGTKIDELDVLAWAQFVENEGETTQFQPQNVYSSSAQENTRYSAIIGGYTDSPSYDVGIKGQTSALTFLLNSRSSHYIEPFSAGGVSGEPYDYNVYAQLNSPSPGLKWVANHLQMGHLSSTENWLWKNEIFFDLNEVDSSVVINPNVQLFATPQWKEKAYGASSILKYAADDADYLVGVQYEKMEITDSNLRVSSNGSALAVPAGAPKLLALGSESIWSVFFQAKYQITEQVLLNVGGRYDAKDRYLDQEIRDYNPRLSLVYSGDDNFNVKLSYASAFVDATYWNRFSTLASFRGAQSLRPEYLKSLQLTPSWALLNNQVHVTANFFYNDLEDFIFRDKSAGVDEANYSNAGQLTSWGSEFEVKYANEMFSLHGVLGFQRAITAERFSQTDGHIHNIPRINGNLIAGFQMAPSQQLNVIAKYNGRQYSPIDIQSNGVQSEDPFPGLGVSFNNPFNQVKSRWVIDANYKYQLNSHIQLELDLHNVFDLTYTQGGTTQFPYPQQGRSIRFTFNYRL